jgi:hypothetical protein
MGMKRISLFAILALLLPCLNTNAALPATQPFFPIMAWTGVPSDPAELREMRDCGITIAGLAHPDVLDAAQAAGLKVMVEDPRARSYDWQNIDPAAVKKNLTELLAQTANHPAVLGYYLWDEPHSALFAGLAKVSATIQELAPGKIPFINLLPNYATPDQLGASSYDDYLEKYIQVSHPSLLSYDHYALLDDGSLRDGYYQNLQSLRNASVKHNIPFWNVVLAVGHLSYRVPSRADFLFQAYTTLASGGRGIVYFMYTSAQVGNYRQAPIDQFGNRTETWYAMQHANRQVLCLAPTLLKLRSNDLYHVGNVPHDCRGPGETSLLKTINGGGDYLVGDFTHDDGSRYVLIVNKDVRKSHPCFPVFTKPTKSVHVILPYPDATPTPFEGEQCWLAPGQGALLRVEAP